MHPVSLRSGAVALLSVFLAFCWQWAEVRIAFHGNWTALFCAGGQFQRPPELQDREYVFAGVAGYDGQFYQEIAHDPLLVRHFDRFIDVPRLRYRRILIPGLAWLLAAGQPARIDWAYFAVCWFFVALGTLSLARLAREEGRAALWGLLFLVTPATLSGLERMTVDIGLTALAPAAIFAARKQRWLLLWIVCAAAMLAKETGVLVIVAVSVWLARQQRYRLTAAISSSVLPAAAWYAYVQTRTMGDYGTADFKFLSAFFVSFTAPLHTNAGDLLFRGATAAAVIGILWAAVRSIYLGFQNHFRDLEYLLCFLFGALVLLFQNSSVWVEPNGFTRVYSPLFVCLFAATWRRGFKETLISFAMAACPMGMQLGVHLAGPLWRSCGMAFRPSKYRLKPHTVLSARATPPDGCS